MMMMMMMMAAMHIVASDKDCNTPQRIAATIDSCVCIVVAVRYERVEQPIS